jgi:microfibrillar-associated protein 1
VKDLTPLTLAEKPKPQKPVETKPSFVVVEDRRLQRLQQMQVEVSEDRIKRRVRTVEAAEVVEPEVLEPKQRVVAAPEVLMEEQDDTVSSRQSRLAKAKQAIKEEEELPVSEEEEDLSEEDSSEEDTSSSDDEWGLGSRPAIQPRFISKDQRNTIKKEEDEEEELQKHKEEKARILEEKRERTLQQLREFKEREIEAEEMKAKDEIDVNTDDEGEEEQQREFEMWKLRELQRIKRDREQREAARLERAQIEARRGMTDDEVIADKIKLGDGVKEKRQMKFLQKYYHKGMYTLYLFRLPHDAEILQVLSLPTSFKTCTKDMIGWPQQVKMPK